eukprot:1500789-Rhodomonas_salina.2
MPDCKDEDCKDESHDHAHSHSAECKDEVSPVPYKPPACYEMPSTVLRDVQYCSTKCPVLFKGDGALAF